MFTCYVYLKKTQMWVLDNSVIHMAALPNVFGAEVGRCQRQFLALPVSRLKGMT